jgi:hypothetical protein
MLTGSHICLTIQYLWFHILNDISLHNVQLGQDGKVWLIGLEYSGVMAYTHKLSMPQLWLLLAPFIAGRHKSKNAFFFGRGLILLLTILACGRSECLLEAVSSM